MASGTLVESAITGEAFQGSQGRPPQRAHEEKFKMPDAFHRFAFQSLLPKQPGAARAVKTRRSPFGVRARRAPD